MQTKDAARVTALAILVVLTAINFLNYLDRYVLSAVLEPLSGELSLSDDESGFLATAFMGVYMVAAPFGGHLGDRWSRHKIAAIGVALWSLATIGTGTAEDYPTLLAMRAAVGIGEAGYATVAPSVIADLFRPAERGRKLAYFYLAIPMGSALGYLVGGAIGQEFGWRAAFWVAGVPGLLFAVIAWFLPEPKRGASEHGDPVFEKRRDPKAPARGEALADAAPMSVAVREVFGSKAWRTNTLGTTLMTFSMGGIAFWMPTYLVRDHALELGEANMIFGGLTVVAGLIGTLVGGFLGDKMFAKGEGGYFRLSGWGLLLGAPFALLMPYAGIPVLVFTLAFFAELLLFLNTGPLNAALVACVRPEMRARAVAINVFFIHALGDAVSPWMMGLVSEQASLALAIALTSVPIAAGGIVLIRASKTHDREGLRPGASGKGKRPPPKRTGKGPGPGKPSGGAKITQLGKGRRGS